MTLNAHEAGLFQVRTGLVQAWLRDRGYDGILLTRADNFAMATGGARNYVSRGTDEGACALFINKDRDAWFVGNNIEAPRVLEEELAGLAAGAKDFLWFEGSAADAVEGAFKGTLVSDDGSVGPNVNGDLAGLRGLLTPRELDKYRKLGALAAEAMTASAMRVSRGIAEVSIAAGLVAEAARRRCFMPVVLVAADDRIAKYRHPLPTTAPLLDSGRAEHKVEKYVMLVGCFQREGLIVSMTRFVETGAAGKKVHDALARIAAIDAVMQEESKLGATLGDVFAMAEEAYPRFGFAGKEWHKHHQGGLTGYAPRVAKGAPGSAFAIGGAPWDARVSELLGREVSFGHAFAWNPSAPGVKSEDTFILHPDGKTEIVTPTRYFPSLDLAAVLGRPTPVVKAGMLER